MAGACLVRRRNRLRTHPAHRRRCHPGRRGSARLKARRGIDNQDAARGLRACRARGREACAPRVTLDPLGWGRRGTTDDRAQARARRGERPFVNDARLGAADYVAVDDVKRLPPRRPAGQSGGSDERLVHRGRHDHAQTEGPTPGSRPSRGTSPWGTATTTSGSESTSRATTCANDSSTSSTSLSRRPSPAAAAARPRRTPAPSPAGVGRGSGRRTPRRGGPGRARRCSTRAVHRQRAPCQCAD